MNKIMIKFGNEAALECTHLIFWDFELEHGNVMIRFLHKTAGQGEFEISQQSALSAIKNGPKSSPDQVFLDQLENLIKPKD